jgi:hypothetical protein
MNCFILLPRKKPYLQAAGPRKETFAQFGNRILETRIGDFSGSPARKLGKIGTAPDFSWKNRELSLFSRELSPFSGAGSKNVQRVEGSRFPKVSKKEGGKPQPVAGAVFPPLPIQTDMGLLLFPGRDGLDRALFRTGAAVRT